VRRSVITTAPLVSNDLWEAVEPLLPKASLKPKGGRPQVPDRAALSGIVFVLRTGCPWRMLPKELGCGSGWTCWRRLRDWQEASVWERLHMKLLNWLGDEAAVDWSRASADSLSVRAKRGANLPAVTQLTGANEARSTTSSWTAMASRRGIDSSERLGRYRCVVERSLAWLLGCRRLGVRYERREDLLQGLLHLACALLCLRFLAAE
jgi:transposase